MLSVRKILFSLAFVFSAIVASHAQQTKASGSFTLYKFAKAIGTETYTIEPKGDQYDLASHFLFTDRGTPVGLETTYSARTSDLAPLAYASKGRAARTSEMDDRLNVTGNSIAVQRSGNAETRTVSGKWFITDGYSPVAMQEQMMRWWLASGKPDEFTIYPSAAKVHIKHSETLTIGDAPTQGYTVQGLIWGTESLWMDNANNLAALVSIDAELDHFEAVRQPYMAGIDRFIAAAAKANLAVLAKLSASSQAPPGHVLAIVGATLENSTGAAPISDSVILIEDGVVTAVGTRAQVKIPKRATVLDATGKYAIPGLWDMHAHYEQVEWGPIYLASGITSVRDVGNEFGMVQTLHAELNRKQDPAIGPHLEFAGIIDGSGPMSLGAVIADTPEQAREWVQRYKAAGARQIKIYSSVKPEIVKAIAAEAHALGMTVTGHIPNGMTAIDGINDGMDQINHVSYVTPYIVRPGVGADGKPDSAAQPVAEPDGPRAKELMGAMKAHHTVLDPTVALYEMMIHSKPMDQLEPGIDHLPPQLRAALDSPAASPARAASVDARFQLFLTVIRTLHAAGIPIVAGTDQAIPGYSLHREIELYVDSGFTPLEAIQAATIVPARALGVDKESGSIDTGKRGDVLLLTADPLKDIHNTRTVWKTIAAGKVYEPAPLWNSVGFIP